MSILISAYATISAHMAYVLSLHADALEDVTNFCSTTLSELNAPLLDRYTRPMRHIRQGATNR